MSFYDLFGILLKHVYKLYITYIYNINLPKQNHHKKYQQMCKIITKKRLNKNIRKKTKSLKKH